MSSKRLNEFKMRFMDESIKEYLEKSPDDVEAWLYYARNMSQNDLSEQSLNILSQALEMNPDSELLWLEYLSAYSSCSQYKDYNEICLLAIDNCSSYEVFWKILNTIPFEHTDEIIERFKTYLVSTETNTTNRSFYICEMVIYHVYAKLVSSCDLASAKDLFTVLYKEES